MSEPLAAVPSGAIQRLTEHYGASVQPWLRGVPGLVASTAARWEVAVSGYHDAGWTSVVVTGQGRTGRQVVLKALPETSRYRHERAALEHWAGQRVCRLLDADDDAQVLLLESVTNTVGGAPRPPDHPERVASVLAQLHERPPPEDAPVPLLSDYYADVVVPRISRRGERWGGVIGSARVTRALRVSEELGMTPCDRSMLHADLYSENVLFDERAEPVFIDPHPKIGSGAFDWAFWCVYYAAGDFAERVDLCRHHGRIDMDEMLAWAVTLVIDGALYSLDTGDRTAALTLALIEPPVLAPVMGRH
jgi:streptomycin 6-kinase